MAGMAGGSGTEPNPAPMATAMFLTFLVITSFDRVRWSMRDNLGERSRLAAHPTLSDYDSERVGDSRESHELALAHVLSVNLERDRAARAQQ